MIATGFPVKRAEVVAFVEVGDESGVSWRPAQQFSGHCVRCRGVGAEKGAQPVEVVEGLVGRDGHHGYAESAADRLGDHPGRHAFLGGGVQHAASG